MSETSYITLQIWRFAPETDTVGHFQTYEVESAEPLSIMALLAKVHEMDPSFACRTSTCFKGMCGSCLIRCNGRDLYGCTTLLAPGETGVIEPCFGFRVVRDVVVDFSQPVMVAEEV